jgi:hypothetical protein
MSDDKIETVRLATVALVMALRAQYLAGGASPLKHWTQITERMRAAAATTSGPREWASVMLRKLGVQAPSRETSSAIERLVAAVEIPGVGDARFLALVDREWGYLIALARAEAEERQERRRAELEAAKTATSGPHSGEERAVRATERELKLGEELF